MSFAQMMNNLLDKIKKRWKELLALIGLGVILATGSATPPDISPEKVLEKYQQATEIKAKYVLDGVELERKIIKNAELDNYKNEPKDEIKITIGDNTPVIKEGLFGASGTSTEFTPSIELKRWNEVSFKIKPKGLDKIAAKDKTLSFEGDKIKYGTPAISFEMFETTEGEGGYKYVWILNEKPASNKVEFEIESSGLDFIYQPPLTQEYQNGYSEEFKKEIVVSETQVKDLDGNVLVERPENVVGSYAVYHSTKGGMNDTYGKDYKVGKAFHIYSSHLTDAEGKTSKAILKIENGIFSEEIPQEFLDKVVYPIRGNTEFGYHGSGGTVGGWTANYITACGDLYMGASGTGNSMSFYGTSVGGTGKVVMALYDSSNKKITNSNTAQGTLPDLTPAWVTVNSSSPDLTAQNYYLVFNFSTNNNYYYDTGATNVMIYQSYTYNT